jgi:hypothetical protein
VMGANDGRWKVQAEQREPLQSRAVKTEQYCTAHDLKIH